MLNERINELLNGLQVTKLAISEYAGIDRTAISHIASGKRIHNRYSATMVKIIDGIYLYSKDNDKLDTISEITGVEATLPAEDFKTGITDWLYEDMPAKYVIDKKNDDKATYLRKASVLLDRYNISNAEISERVKCDPAVASRYRNGGKDVNPSSRVSVGIAEIIWERVEDAKDYVYISKASGIRRDKLNTETFRFWFTNHNAAIIIPRDINTKRILEAFSETATTKPVRHRRSKNIILPIMQDNAPETYIGNEGLRQAVEQFFATALEKKPKQIYLYSDNPMDWMTEDTEFFTKWQNSMMFLIQKGVRIIIIHNLKRSAPEMINAIAGWLPLYQTGKVEPYYFEQVRLSNIFSHTLFINPKGHAITGMTVKGATDESLYHYHTDPTEISMLHEGYSHMMESATPLVEHPDNIPENAECKTYEYNGIHIVITEDEVYLTHIETGVNIGLKHHLLVKSFDEFCDGL